MPRPDRYRDDDDRDPPPRQSTSPVLIIALVLGGLLVVGVVACGGLMFLGFQAGRDAEERAVQAEAKVAGANAGKGTTRVYTRQEFQDLVMGKTEDEVIEVVGKPDSTQENGVDPESADWFYNDRTRDPVSGKIDPRAHVTFRMGKVARVNY